MEVNCGGGAIGRIGGNSGSGGRSGGRATSEAMDEGPDMSKPLPLENTRKLEAWS